MNVWKAEPRDEVHKEAKVISRTWEMKKSSGTFRGGVNA